jgi:Mce-associated membrane protein
MATKLFKRTNHEDVFEKVVEHPDPPPVKDTQTATDTGDSPTSQTTDAAEMANEDVATATAERADDHPDGGAPRRTRRLFARRTSQEAAADEAVDDDNGDAQPAAPSRRRRWVRNTLTALAILISLAALASAGYFGWHYKQHKDIDSASRAALSSAEHFAVTLTSIDTSIVDQNFSQVVDGSTGEFKDMYIQSASQLRQVLIDNKAMSKGTVIDSAVKSASKNKVDVVLFVDQWITNAASPQPRLDRSRVTMTMERVDGRWLASKVELK